MAANDLNQKYTIERYCSKNDLTKLFGTRIVEPIWNELVEFRRRLSTDLPFFDTSRIKYRLIYIDSTQVKTAQTNDHVTAYMSGFSKLQAGSVALYTFTRDMLKGSLKSLAKFNKLDASEITINNILDGEPVAGQYKVLETYFKALQALKRSSNEDINEDFLAKYYGILRDEEELTCFYRESDVETLASKVLVARDYDQGIPSHLIDEFMPVLLEYIANSDISLASRLSAIFFMFNYVKPFDKFNMEIACLLAKRIIAGTNVNASSIYVPLESFLNDEEFFGEVSKEVKRTHDFTYAFLRGSDLINSAFDVAIDRILDVQAHTLDLESKVGSDEKKIEEEFAIKPAVKKVQPKVSETKAQILQKIEKNAEHFASEPVSEKELKARANDMLESNPYLSKHQANFYVHHCTPGKYYSLQQYVKFTGCVYETARTSMEFLAKEGYYRKETIKNKFVYTPINKE